MKHRITRDEAALVRFIATGSGDDYDPAMDSPRIWRPPLAGGALGDEPIGVVPASGRAGCRECGETIEAAADAIAFGFSPTGAVWDVGRAYIHAAPCRDYPEED